jgi:hypothetical protein
MQPHQPTPRTPGSPAATPAPSRPPKLGVPSAVDPAVNHTLGWFARDPSGTPEDPGAIEYASWLRLLRRARP